MTTIRRWWKRLLGSFAQRSDDDDMTAELQSHITLQTDENIRRGMTPAEARRAAIVKFGGVEATKERVRDQRGVPALERFASDLRYALRGIGRNRPFATAVIATLALGIGANTAIFSLIYTMLIRPLPYSDPEQIYSVEIVIPERRAQFASLPVTVQSFLEWRKSQTVFASMASLRQWECNLTGDGEPERTGGARVSANFFEMLGVDVAHGRGFLPEEEVPGKDRVVVISDGLWRRRYGSDPSIIGRHISVNGQSYLVVGIAPPSLLAPTGSQLHPVLQFAPRIDLWSPDAPTARELQGESWDRGVLVRLKNARDLETGRDQLRAILLHLVRSTSPNVRIDFQANLVPIREIFAGRIRQPLLFVLCAAALLLLTACANVANLLLARIASREAEFATRIALGAGTGRILSQTLTESLLLSALGGAGGLVVAWYGAALATTHGPDDLQLGAGSPLHWPVLMFAVAASLITGILCGLFPAWRSFRSAAWGGLQDGMRGHLSGRRSGRMRELLIIGEMAMATVLLAAAGLLLHSFVRVTRADRGYHVSSVLAVDLSLFGKKYAAGEARVGFYERTAASIRNLPGVLAAGAISDLPATSGPSGASRTIFLEADSDFASTVLSRPVAMVRAVTSGYFAASGTPLVAGRFFAESEPELAAIVSRSFARRLFPNEAPGKVVGRRVRQGNTSGPLILITGVVEDTKPAALDREPAPLIYRPHAQWSSGPMTLLVRTADSPEAIGAAVRNEIRQLDPQLPIVAMRTMQEIVSKSVSQRRFQMLLTLLFGAAALLLGSVGIYGVVSYAVTCRTREVGLRMALGALEHDVARWIFARGMRSAVAGLVLGLAGAAAISKVLRSFLFGIGPADPLTLISVIAVLLASSAAGCYFPARRAGRLDPVVALRHD